MNKAIFHAALCALCLFACAAGAFELDWTRTTGQTRPEGAPALVEGFAGEPLLASVNLGGQVMLWRLDGTDFGSGQDGTVFQLPQGQWSSSPAVVQGVAGPLLVFCSVDGQVVAFNGDFTKAWEHQLAEGTWWSRATPLVVDDRMYFGDKSGAVTCLLADGSVSWQFYPGKGPCRTWLAAAELEQGPVLVAALGTSLCIANLDGAIQWSHDFSNSHPQGQMLAAPVVVKHIEQDIILCGVDDVLYAVTPHTGVLWQQKISSTLDATIALLPREDREPLILCQGLWGNLHAFDLDGKPVWTHLFRSKTRARPLVADFNGDGKSEAAVTGYNQRVFLVNEEGERIDETRLSGLISALPVPVSTGASADMIIVTHSLLAHRVRCGEARAVYGLPPAEGPVTIEARRRNDPMVAYINNPEGRLMRVAAQWQVDDGSKVIAAAVTARTRLEIELPEGVDAKRVTVKSARGEILADQDVRGYQKEMLCAVGDRLTAWAEPPYGDYAPHRGREIRIEPVYIGEIDQGALAVLSMFNDPVPVRITVDTPKREDTTPFGGALVLREMVAVGTFNGERVADALPELNDGGVVVIPARHEVKIWVSVDAHGAAAGEYTGSVTVTPLDTAAEPVTLPLVIVVPDLVMPDPLPLTLCTWDYVPNNWFGESAARETLDDMAAHGVNVFPRTDLPPGKVDESGSLSMDWAKLDAMLDRLRGRGQILIQLCQPPLEFAQPATPEQTHAHELEYVRTLCAHLIEKGFTYADFALYPVDEPGLDYGPRVPVYVKAAQLFREADANIRIYTDPVPGLSLRDYQQIAPLTDVWCPNMRLVNGLVAGDPRIKDIIESGKTVWSYECVSQVRSLSPLCYNRSNAWRAWYFGLDGIGFWTHCTTTTDPWLTGKTTQDEYALVYPGKKPVPSVRWEAARDGLEDIGAFSLLKTNAYFQDRVRDPEVVKQAERLLATAAVDVMELSDQSFTESRDFLREGDRRIWHSPTDVELFAEYRKKAAELTLALRK